MKERVNTDEFVSRPPQVISSPWDAKNNPHQNTLQATTLPTVLIAVTALLVYETGQAAWRRTVCMQTLLGQHSGLSALQRNKTHSLPI